LHCRLFIFCN